MKRFNCLAFVGLLFSFAAYADSLSYVTGTVYQVEPSLAAGATSGAAMSGMKVTAFYGSTSVTASWVATGSIAGGATAPGKFRLTEMGDTFKFPWTLANLSTDAMTRLTIEGAPGKTVFEVCLHAPCNSDSAGKTFARITGSFAGTYTGTVDTTYVHKVELGDNPPVGDRWEELDLVFGDTGMASGKTLWWYADADSVPLSGTITEVVPEPGSWILLGTCAGLVATRRRRRAV